ncbi:glycoside hydrolase superfamily [Polychytrium aggregatum]|uniref:glycoside hydrolase superfamily n=1 Tax=Polychytrium aggregatum TaxID=110093 RepID=UPI0022FE7838|nr:glycoside hydrolase superfamily [Polychytrium aggregatum]KAI9205030.1 glycoside hydrolase superfamily [Polychytrium aggregatum]
MKFLASAATAAVFVGACVSQVSALAPLEPDTGIYFGTWYDRLGGDTPTAINSRLNYKPLTLFQSDLNISSTLQDPTQIFQQMQTVPGAVLLLTLFMYDSLDGVSDAALSDLGNKLAQYNSQGGKVILRYASEMNGNWFKYGQRPSFYKQQYIRAYNIVHPLAPQVAWVWSPNAANGYPFGNSTQTPLKGTQDFTDMDTNNDGQLTDDDDPYTPFYPGDQYVDWVGISLYHYGYKWPWVTNDIPVPGKFEGILSGGASGKAPGDSAPYAKFNFYEMFSGSGAGAVPKPATAGGKPLMISETAATYHVYLNNSGDLTQKLPLAPGVGSVADIKRGWWNQILNDTIKAKYPKLKSVCFFDFKKWEETTYRDFTSFSTDYGVVAALNQDVQNVKLIRWADGSSTNNNTNPNNKSAASTLGRLVPFGTVLVAAALGALSLY